MHCTIEMVKNNTGQRNKHDLQCQLNLKSNLSSNTCLSCALRHRRRSSRRLGFSSFITQDVEILSDNIFSLIYHRKKPLRNIKYIGHNLINWINLFLFLLQNNHHVLLISSHCSPLYFHFPMPDIPVK